MTTKRVSADVRCLSLCARWHHWNPRWLTEPRKHINNTAFDKRRGLCFIRRGSRSVSAPANPLNYFHYLTKCSWQSGIAVVDCAANGLCPFHKAPTASCNNAADSIPIDTHIPLDRSGHTCSIFEPETFYGQRGSSHFRLFGIPEWLSNQLLTPEQASN